MTHKSDVKGTGGFSLRCGGRAGEEFRLAVQACEGGLLYETKQSLLAACVYLFLFIGWRGAVVLNEF